MYIHHPNQVNKYMCPVGRIYQDHHTPQKGKRIILNTVLQMGGSVTHCCQLDTSRCVVYNHHCLCPIGEVCDEHVTCHYHSLLATPIDPDDDSPVLPPSSTSCRPCFMYAIAADNVRRTIATPTPHVCPLLDPSTSPPPSFTTNQQYLCDLIGHEEGRANPKTALPSSRNMRTQTAGHTNKPTQHKQQGNDRW